MVAPTWDLMSSPAQGMPAVRKRSPQPGSDAMNTGMQFTSDTPVARQASA
jgi:hypothetical protein